MLVNYITNILNLKGVKITNIVNNKKEIKLDIMTKAKEHTCPCCGAKTKHIKD